VHRWDAEGVTGAPQPLHEGLAEDGVPEFIEIMVGADLASLPGAVTLTATDIGASWRVAGTAAGGSGGSGGSETGRSAGRMSELQASASDLVLMLYRRLPVPDDAIVGDPILVAALLSLADTR
jgi:hypothetical protein